MMPGRRIFAKGVLIVCAALVLLAGLGYAAVCVWFVANERSLVFFRKHLA